MREVAGSIPAVGYIFTHIYNYLFYNFIMNYENVDSK